MFGTVTRYDNQKGYGFIQGDDGNSYFIHRSNLNGEYIENGYYVFFRSFTSDRSDYNAMDISVVDIPERNKRHKKRA